MIHTIAQKTADIFGRQNVADEEKKEIYIYGIELLVSSLIGAVLILGISIGIGKIWSGVVFLSVFILVRQYTGGYHADTYVRCNAAFVLTYLLTVGIWIFCRVHDLKVAVWFILLGAYIIMAVLAPVENKNKPLDDEEVKKYKWKSIVIYSAFIMVVLAADITGVFYEGCLYIKIILIIIAVLMVLGKFKENLTE
jgi:accessory gene regulator B